MNSLKVFKRRVPSSIESIRLVVDGVISSFQKTCSGLDECTEFKLRVVLNELVLNAIKHGNCDDGTKFFSVKACVAQDNCALVVIRDQGIGYNHNISHESCRDICLQDISTVKETGRGILLVNSLCDKVRYNRKGNCVLFIMKLNAPPLY